MTPIPFSKMNGSGNDFIVIDNRENVFTGDDPDRFVRRVCRRKLSVGADGLILIENTQGADFRWRFFNADGSRAEMCGNGARCAARFAWLNGIAGKNMAFETDAGRISAEIIHDRVKVGMTDPFDFVPETKIPLAGKTYVGGTINTGVPHVVIETEALDTMDIVPSGRDIRFHEQFAPAGTNVNYVQQTGDRSISVRTYERGVEGETLACGTGSVAAALVTSARNGWSGPVDVKTRGGGMLKVYFESTPEGFKNVFLEGDARLIYSGNLMADALME